jgi:hypothetical protein
MTIYTAYDQLATLLATLEPGKLSALKASEELQKRFEFLVEVNKEGSLSKEEKDELDHYVVLERLVRLAKIRAMNR